MRGQRGASKVGGWRRRRRRRHLVPKPEGLPAVVLRHQLDHRLQRRAGHRVARGGEHLNERRWWGGVLRLEWLAEAAAPHPAPGGVIIPNSIALSHPALSLDRVEQPIPIASH